MKLRAAILALALGVIAAPVVAQEAIATARALPNGPERPMPAGEAAAPQETLTTDAQIRRWIAAGREAEAERPELALAEAAPRRVHGEVGAMIGSGDMSGIYGEVNAPLGEAGQLSLRFRQSRGARAYGFDPFDFGYGDPGGHHPWMRPSMW